MDILANSFAAFDDTGMDSYSKLQKTGKSRKNAYLQKHDFGDLYDNPLFIQQYKAYQYNFRMWEKNLREIRDETIEATLNVNEIIDGRLSFAYENLKKLPKRVVKSICKDVTHLDLSHNDFRNVKFLVKFRELDTLVLDRNNRLELSSVPELPNLKILYMNFCDIKSLTKSIFHLSTYLPNLSHLSLMGNPIANTFGDRCTPITPHDYRMFVIFFMKKLTVLDDKPVTQQERDHATEYHATLYFRECPFDDEEQKHKLNLIIEPIGLETIEEERSRDIVTTPDSSIDSESSLDFHINISNFRPNDENSTDSKSTKTSGYNSSTRSSNLNKLKYQSSSNSDDFSSSSTQ